MTFVKFKMAVL